MGAAVVGPAAGLPDPVVADEALLDGEFADLEHLPLVDFGAPDNQVEGAVVGWRVPDVVEAGFEFRCGWMFHRVIVPEGEGKRWFKPRPGT